MKTQTTDKSGKKSESLFEIEGEGKSHMVTYRDGKEIMNIITINNTTYTKDYSDNKWWKQIINKTKDEDKPANFNIEELKKKMTESISDELSKISYKKIGKEACDGRQCFKYQLIMLQDFGMTQYIYIDDQEYLMRKTRTESKDGLITDTTFLYQKVTIAEPSPVKEFKVGEINPLNLFKEGSLDKEKIQEMQKKFQQSTEKQETTE